MSYQIKFNALNHSYRYTILSLKFTDTHSGKNINDKKIKRYEG